MMPNVRPPASAESKSSSLINRMHAAVSHYRSPSADRPIDLTHVKDETPPPSAPKDGGTSQIVSNARAEEDDDEDYIPPGLADFVAAANRELEETQQEFLNFTPSTPSAPSWEREDYTYQRTASGSSLREDEDDRALKSEILNRFSGEDTASMMSPDLLTSPPPNPVTQMSDSHIKQQALEGAFTSPPPPYHTVVADSGKTRVSPPAVGNSFASPSAMTDHPVAPKSTSNANRFFVSSPAAPKQGEESSSLQGRVAIGNSFASSPSVNPPIASVGMANPFFVSPFPAAKPSRSSATRMTTKVMKNTIVPSETDYFAVEKEQEVVLNTAESSTVQHDADSEILPDQKDLMELISDMESEAAAAPSPVGNENAMINFGDFTVETTPANGPRYLGDETVQTPSPLSMSSPSKSSAAARKKEELFAEQLRSSHRVRASSPVYGFAPAPEEHLILSARLAADAARTGAPPPTPASTVTGPVPVSAKKQTPMRTATGTTIFAEAKGATSPQRRLGPPLISSFSEVQPSVPQITVNYQMPKAPQPVVSHKQHPPPLPITSQLPPVAPMVRRSPSPLSMSSGNQMRNVPTPTESSLKKSPLPIATEVPASAPNAMTDTSPPNIANQQATSIASSSQMPSPPQLSTQLPRGAPNAMATPLPRNTVNQQATSAGSKNQTPIQPAMVPNAMTTPSPLSMSSGNKEQSIEPERASSAGGTQKHSSLPPISAQVAPISDAPNTRTTPSPLSMSSPRFQITGAAWETPPLTGESSTTSSPPPRFSPPSSPQIKTAARFTAETAERLSKPATKSPPPPLSTPHLASEKKPLARFTAESAERLSRQSKKATTPPPPQATQPLVSSAQDIVTARFTAESAGRLSKPTVARTASSIVTAKSPAAAALQPKTDLASKSSTAPRVTRQEALAQKIASAGKANNSRSTAERLSRPTDAHEASHSSPIIAAPEKLPVQSISHTKALARQSSGSPMRLSPAAQPSPHLFTDESAERLSRPTVAWSAAVQAASPKRSPPAVPPPLSPHIFTPEAAERLSRLTVARSAAIIAASPRRHPSTGYVNAHEHSDSHDGTQDLPGNAAVAASERRTPLKVQILEPSSHLLQSTAVSEARKTTPRKLEVRPPPPKKIVSGVSDRLMTRTAANQAAVDDGPAKARERLRQRMLDQQRQQTKPSGYAQALGKPKYSAADGIAKARERLRQRQLQQQNVPGKENRNVEPGVSGVHIGSRHPTVARRPPSGKRVLTVPHGPKFATSARHGDRPVNGRSDLQTLAQSVDVFGKGLRDDMSASAGSNGSSHRNLTIPTAPKFATDTRCGERHKPPRTRADVSLAQCTDVLQKGLRAPYAAPPVKRAPGPTIPHSPKFHKLPHRELPKSTEEKELEDMAYFKSHPFRATSIGTNNGQTPPNRRMTMPPQPSNVRTERSLATGGSMPSFMQPTKGHVARAQGTPPTAHVRIPNLRSRTEPRVQQKAAFNETPKPFKARPAPLSTFQAPPPVSPSGSPTTPTEPFHLATSSRHEKHSTMTEASRRRTEQLSQEREARATKRISLLEQAHQKKLDEERRERRRQVAKVTHHTVRSEHKPTEVKPFRFASAARREAAAEEARQKLATEDEERRRQTEFKAKPVPKTTYSYKPIARKPSGPLVEPFSPEMQTKQRVVARKEFDAYAEQERDAALAHARAVEVQRVVEEQEELRERRRLPVKEGGMIPTAEPVNAVFWNDR